MQRSWLPPGGANLFQEIKRKCAEAEGNGKELIRLSIGQPTGAALLSARIHAAELIMRDDQGVHEYQDNGCLPDPEFPVKFGLSHIPTFFPLEKIDALPIPGIKPMLPLIPFACGIAQRSIVVATTTQPGYPTPADWCGGYLQRLCEHRALTLTPQNAFRFDPEELKGVDLLMMNYPGNPTGQVANREWLEAVCRYCAGYNIRIFNDAAYAILAHSPEHVTLTEVAINIPGLSWAEAFSASKAGNFTGWRVGAILGSPDFIGDIRTVKGNADSGFNAALALGALYSFLNDNRSIQRVRLMYAQRLELLIKALSSLGMQLAVQPGAGFFSLWQVPGRAFDQEITSAEQFNYLMIERTGVVGVHFNPNYIRYAVVADIESLLPKISAAFATANVSY